MKKLTSFIKGFAIDYVLGYMKDNKAMLIDKANKKLDLPILSENQEEKLLDALFDCTIEMVEGIKEDK